MEACHSGQSTFVGRDVEHRAVLGIVQRLRDGHGDVLVLRGECGSGKTFLVERVVESVMGVRVVRVPGIEAEELLPYAALDRLLRPLRERVPDLSGRHRDVLDAVFGERPGTTLAVDVILATSALLDRAGGSEPVLYLIDDAQWIDRVTGEVLSAVCGDERQSTRSFLFCVRERPEPGGWLGNLPQVRLAPLDHDESMMLLVSSLSGGIDKFAAKRLVRVANGNPLALTSFVHNHEPGRAYHHAWSDECFRLPERLETDLLRSVDARSASAGLLLLLSVVEPLATMEDFRKAGRMLGAEVDPAEVADLLSFEPHPVFQQPLLALAVARRATAFLRHRIHVVLGLVLGDRARRAWHIALSAHGHNETIAGALDVAARREELHGRHRRAEMYFRRSAELGNEERRASRLVSAARMALLTKDYRLTRDLVDEALLTRLDSDLGPEVFRIRAVLSARAGDKDTLLALDDVLEDMRLLDARAAGDTWFETLDGVLLADGQMPRTKLGQLAQHILDEAPLGAGQQTPVDVLTAGLAMRATAGYVQAVPLMRRIATTLDTVDDADPSGWHCRRWQSLIALTLLELWDIERGARLFGWAVALGARGIDVRILRLAPFALTQGQAAQWDSSEVTVPHTGGRRLVQVAVEAVAGAARGTAEAHAKVKEVIVMASRAGYGFLVSLCHLLLARIAISRGEYDEALVWSQLVYTQDAPGLGGQVLADLVESAVRVGEADVAAAACHRLAVRVRASDSAWGRGLQARAQALCAPDTHAEWYFQTAIRLLEPTAAVLDTGRAQLLYGEWLRRRKRRAEAAHHLGRAYKTFVTLNADAFAERARVELDAAEGRSEGKRDLTAQQRRVAQLAVDGLTRAQIAVRLAISEHTVADHIKQIYRKFGIHSRGQLSEVFARAMVVITPDPRSSR